MFDLLHKEIKISRLLALMEIEFLVTEDSDSEIPMGSETCLRLTFVGVICCIDKGKIMRIDILTFQEKKALLGLCVVSSSFPT